MKLVEMMCDSCHDFYEIYAKDYDSNERPLCLNCELSIAESRRDKGGVKELFEKGSELERKLGMIKGYVQNEGIKYDTADIENFDLEVKNIIKDMGVWKTDMLMFMEQNKI